MTCEVGDAGKLGGARALAHHHGSSIGALGGDPAGSRTVSTGSVALAASAAWMGRCTPRRWQRRRGGPERPFTPRETEVSV